MELLLTDSFCVLGSLQAVCATGRTESITPHFAGKETETQNVYCLCRKSHVLQSAESGLKFGSADCSECSVHYTITACTPLVNFKTRRPEIWNCLYNPNHLKRDLFPVMWINRVSQPAAVGHHGFYFQYNSLFTYFSLPPKCDGSAWGELSMVQNRWRQSSRKGNSDSAHPPRPRSRSLRS